mmetsp:Transcript_22311/g.70074  ORF Transcript_22311/g.70074 Transcript_22311/m.70074 type:complete len:251 (-) Transcript_22311:553-1305(-)
MTPAPPHHAALLRPAMSRRPPHLPLLGGVEEPLQAPPPVLPEPAFRGNLQLAGLLGTRILACPFPPFGQQQERADFRGLLFWGRQRRPRRLRGVRLGVLHRSRIGRPRSHSPAHLGRLGRWQHRRRRHLLRVRLHMQGGRRHALGRHQGSCIAAACVNTRSLPQTPCDLLRREPLRGAAPFVADLQAAGWQRQPVHDDVVLQDRVDNPICGPAGPRRAPDVHRVALSELLGLQGCPRRRLIPEHALRLRS